MDRAADAPHKAHDLATPNTGGVAIFAAIVGPTLLAFALGPTVIWFSASAGDCTDWFERISPPSGPGLSPDGLGFPIALLLSLSLMFGLGLWDDRRALGPGVKIAVQCAVAGLLVVFADVRVLHLLDSAWPYGIGYLLSVGLSVLWIVTIINAFNMLDNMDGLSAGVAAIAAGIYLAQTLIGGQTLVALLAASLLGALLGFLLFNFAPAKLFMGDSGSLVIGLLLGVISIRTTYTQLDPTQAGANAVSDLTSATSGVGDGGPWYGVLTPLLVMAVPLYDLGSVTLIRLSQGRSPFVGDQQHFSHRLVERGLGRRLAVTVIYLAALATGLSGVMLSRVEPWQAWVLATQAAAVMLMIALLEFGGRGQKANAVE